MYVLLHIADNKGDLFYKHTDILPYIVLTIDVLQTSQKYVLIHHSLG